MQVKAVETIRKRYDWPEAANTILLQMTGQT